MPRAITHNLLGALVAAAIVSTPAVATAAKLESTLTPAQRAQLASYQQAVVKLFGSTPGGLVGPTVRYATCGY
jgi:hypothetical protein